MTEIHSTLWRIVFCLQLNLKHTFASTYDYKVTLSCDCAVKKLYSNGTICALRPVPFKPRFHCSFVCHRAYNLPGERRLTGDPVRLAAWQHVSLLSCLHYEPNEWLNSHFCPVLLFCCYSEKGGMIFSDVFGAQTMKHGYSFPDLDLNYQGIL